MIHGIDNVNQEKLFCIAEDERIRKQVYVYKWEGVFGLKFFIRELLINYWNHLTDKVVSCKSLTTFKIKLVKFMTAKGEIYIYCSLVNARLISVTCIILTQSVR